MAAYETGIPSIGSDSPESQLSHGRAIKKVKGSLIENLRYKHGNTWLDSLKMVSQAVTERKVQPEIQDSSGVKECLETLQKFMRVTSKQTLTERLDLIGRQLGLNTQVEDQKVSLSSDSFQVDVLLGDVGDMLSVRLTHQGEDMDCPDLACLLKKGDFPEFLEHLQGLQSIYQVTDDEKLKSKAFLALQALERDLNQLAHFQSSISGVANYIHKCPLGIMLPRLVGKPMRLIFLVSPYDLLDKKSLAAYPLTVEAITENLLGHSVTVSIEAVPESTNNLQTMPLMSVNRTQDGKSLPSFSAINKMNSMLLPASFVLSLPDKTPLSAQILQRILAMTNQNIHKDVETKSLRALIIENSSGGHIKDSRQLPVSLPDQQHIYFLDCLNGEGQEHQGVLVSRIPFTHPTHVPQILTLLRQQLLFNIVIASCVRPGAKTEPHASIVFEVTALSCLHLTVVFEHPVYDSLTRVEIDLSDITSLKCKVASPGLDQILCSDEAISHVFHRCMSIPIMLRWLIRKGQMELHKLRSAALQAKQERLAREQLWRQQQARLYLPPQPPHPPPVPPPLNHQHSSPLQLPAAGVSVNGTTASAQILEESKKELNEHDDVLFQIKENGGQHRQASADRMLMSPDSDKLFGTAAGQREVHDSPILSQLLDANTSVATSQNLLNPKPAQTAPAKPQRKRSSQSELKEPSTKLHHSSQQSYHHRIDSSQQSFHHHMDSSNQSCHPLGAALDPSLGATYLEGNHHNMAPLIRSTTPTNSSLGYFYNQPVLPGNVGPHNNVIDLTDDPPVGQASPGKHFFHRDQTANLDTRGQMPQILHHSATGPKNEMASTSHEHELTGSGEVGTANDFDPRGASPVPSCYSSVSSSKLSTLLMDNSSPLLNTSTHNSHSAFFSDHFGTDKSVHTSQLLKSVSNICGHMDDKQIGDLKGVSQLPPSGGSGELHGRRNMTGLFEKFNFPRSQKTNVKQESSDHKLKLQPSDCKVSFKLKVLPLKQQNSIKPILKSHNSFLENGIIYKKQRSIETFDFRSDEDEEPDDLVVEFCSERLVYSSLAGLHRSSLNKRRFHGSIPGPHQEQAKRKDDRSAHATKRTKQKEESKREKKKKKIQHYIQEPMYHTIENDNKADFKLKIRVAKKSLSEGKVQSYEIAKKPLLHAMGKRKFPKEQVQTNGLVGKGKVGLSFASNADKSVAGKLLHSMQKSLAKSEHLKMSQDIPSMKTTDPKLARKTTIRLQPLPLSQPSSGLVTTNQGLAASKAQRRSSAPLPVRNGDRRVSGSHSLERRNSSSGLMERDRHTSTHSVSSVLLSTASLPTGTLVSSSKPLSVILPNAPSFGKLASLPRIPKLSSTMAGSSVSRTSSLDLASDTLSGSQTAGTKLNNSYTVGPAGRPYSFPGPTRPLAGNAASANHIHRQSLPASAGSAGHRSHSNVSWPGFVHQQTNPAVSSVASISHKSSSARDVRQPQTNHDVKTDNSTSTEIKHVIGNLSQHTVTGKNGFISGSYQRSATGGSVHLDNSMNNTKSTNSSANPELTSVAVSITEADHIPVNHSNESAYVKHHSHHGNESANVKHHSHHGTESANVKRHLHHSELAYVSHHSHHSTELANVKRHSHHSNESANVSHHSHHGTESANVKHSHLGHSVSKELRTCTPNSSHLTISQSSWTGTPGSSLFVQSPANSKSLTDRLYTDCSRSNSSANHCVRNQKLHSSTEGQPPSTGGQPPSTGEQPPSTGGQPPSTLASASVGSSSTNTYSSWSSDCSHPLSITSSTETEHMVHAAAINPSDTAVKQTTAGSGMDQTSLNSLSPSQTGSMLLPWRVEPVRELHSPPSPQRLGFPVSVSVSSTTVTSWAPAGSVSVQCAAGQETAGCNQSHGRSTRAEILLETFHTRISSVERAGSTPNLSSQSQKSSISAIVDKIKHSVHSALPDFYELLSDQDRSNGVDPHTEERGDNETAVVISEPSHSMVATGISPPHVDDVSKAMTQHKDQRISLFNRGSAENAAADHFDSTSGSAGQFDRVEVLAEWSYACADQTKNGKLRPGRASSHSAARPAPHTGSTDLTHSLKAPESISAGGLASSTAALSKLASSCLSAASTSAACGNKSHRSTREAAQSSLLQPTYNGSSIPNAKEDPLDIPVKGQVKQLGSFVGKMPKEADSSCRDVRSCRLPKGRNCVDPGLTPAAGFLPESCPQSSPVSPPVLNWPRQHEKPVRSPEKSLLVVSSVAASWQGQTLATVPSGASTPKDVDSPCLIDDELMDAALGFGS